MGVEKRCKVVSVVRKSLAYLSLNSASMVRIMKPYRSEPVDKLGYANARTKLCSEHSKENDVFQTSAPSDLVQNNISLKITFGFSSLLFVLCSS